tara:strand:+ start:452 stop:742 length:291 start_codon:yes stop_codon:yes gene_type:complete
MFSATNQPVNNGRPKGSRNKRGQFSKELTTQALEQLTLAVNNGEAWAVQEVFKRTHPTLKPITPTDSLDGEMLMLKMKEIEEFEQRLIALEIKNNG